MITPMLHRLCSIFYDSPEHLGRFEPLEGERVPEPYRQLLDHTQHMTVTMERYHGCPVTLHVLQNITDRHSYARSILLARESDGRHVQYGIMRIGLEFLAPSIRETILRKKTPLGRILIEHDVFREIGAISLYRVTPAEELINHLRLPAESPTYGRTALIRVEGQPAVELLEIVGTVDHHSS